MRLGPMETITTFSVVLFAVLALAVILEGRSLMYEFLLGNQQPRNAQRIWHEMRGWKKIWLSSMDNKIIRHREAYRKYIFLYRLYLCMLPALLAVAIAALFVLIAELQLTCLWILTAVCLGFLLLFRIPLGPNRTSKYRSRHK